MSEWVADASALLALLSEEPGCDRVSEVLRTSEVLVGALTVAEVVSKLIDQGSPEDHAIATVRVLELPVADLDEALGAHAGALHGRLRRRGLSLADCACLALALREGATALSADRAWADLDVGVRIDIIR